MSWMKTTGSTSRSSSNKFSNSSENSLRAVCTARKLFLVSTNLSRNRHLESQPLRTAVHADGIALVELPGKDL